MILKELLDSYSDVLTGIFYIRTPEILPLVAKYPTIGIKSSYSAEKKDLVINAKAVIQSAHVEGGKAPPTLRNSMAQISRIFLIAAHDLICPAISNLTSVKNSPIIQFLRHIRNGCAHNNRFHFDSRVIDSKKNCLKLPAQWREKTIEPSLQGEPVIPIFMLDGDVFNLFVDLDSFLKTHGVKM